MSSVKKILHKIGDKLHIHRHKPEEHVANAVQQHQGQAQAQQPQVPAMKFHPGGGIKRALLIGINYVGQQGELKGCVNDVATMKTFITARGYNAQNMQVLVDDPSWNTQAPTKQNIIQGFKWLIQGAKAGDNLFLHYSGHGGRVKDTSGDEKDGFDETIIPADYRSAGQITDDEIFNTLVAPLPAGVRLTAVMDCCHSGTVLDLPYEFTASKKNMGLVFQGGKFNPSALPQMLLSMKWDPSDPKKMGKNAMKLGMDAAGQFLNKTGGAPAAGGGGPGFQNNQNKQVAADVIMFSGCADEQTSADVGNVASFGLPSGSGPGGAGGACTNSLVAAYNARPNITFIQLLEDMRLTLEQKKYTQVPQLSSSKPLDLGAPFSL